jgi:2,4-dienoyl-CoA reductase-like NADH-dependent reductase (Old Yellow Enzyme family)
MKHPLEIIETVRGVWPADRPLFVRISSVDGIDGGIDIADSVAFVNEAKARGGCDRLFVRRLDGIGDRGTDSRGYSFQVPFAEQICREAKVTTMAVGLILHPQQAEDILSEDRTDLIAVGREALFDPNCRFMPNWP